MNNFDLAQEISLVSDQAQWVGVRTFNEQTTYLVSRNGLNSEVSSDIQNGMMVEVLSHDGQLAYYGTSDISKDGFKRAFDEALRLAKLSKEHGLTNFDTSIRPPEKGEYRTPVKKDVREVKLTEIQSQLMQLSERMKKFDNRIIETSAFAMLTHTSVQFTSSNGAEWKQDFHIISRDLSATAKEGSEVQRRSTGLLGRQWGFEALEMDELTAEADKIAAQSIELLTAEECPTETCDLILMPDQLYLQVHESIGHPLELDRILGDERNYAGWSFVSPEDFGQLKWGPNFLNVSFDPTLENEMASYRYDDNGVVAQKQYLIENGTLMRGIGGIESQKRSGIPGVSCARSTSWNRPPMDRMANINIEPGTSSLDEIIKSTKRGILMHTNRSWSIDDYRNKFQFGCEYAQLIEDGKITKTLKNPNYRGATVSFWNNLTHVGNEDTFQVWGSPYCGKGEPNQVIRVGHAIPICKFENIEVFGGA